VPGQRRLPLIGAGWSIRAIRRTLSRVTAVRPAILRGLGKVDLIDGAAQGDPRRGAWISVANAFLKNGTKCSTARRAMVFDHFARFAMRNSFAAAGKSFGISRFMIPLKLFSIWRRRAFIVSPATTFGVDFVLSRWRIPSNWNLNHQTLARIIHESPDTEGLICYKHVVKTVFEAEKEAFA